MENKNKNRKPRGRETFCARLLKVLFSLYAFNDLALLVCRPKYTYINTHKEKEGEKVYQGRLMDCWRKTHVLKAMNEETKPHTGSPAQLPPYLSRGLSYSAGQPLLAACRKADSTTITRAIISIIHACSAAPRQKADSCGAHGLMPEQSLSLLLCCPPSPALLHPWGFAASFRAPAGKASQLHKLCLLVLGNGAEPFCVWTEVRPGTCSSGRWEPACRWGLPLYGKGRRGLRVVCLLSWNSWLMGNSSHSLGNAGRDRTHAKHTHGKVTLPFVTCPLARDCLTGTSSSTFGLLRWTATLPSKHLLIRNDADPFQAFLRALSLLQCPSHAKRMQSLAPTRSVGSCKHQEPCKLEQG